MRLLRNFAAILGCLIFATTVAAQQREVAGFVRAANTNQAVEGTIVSLQSDIGEHINQINVEGNGYFSFSSLNPGVYYVAARAPGYKETRSRADLFSSRRVSVHMMLQPDPKAAPPPAVPPAATIDERILRIPEPARKEYQKGNELLMVQKDAKGSIEHFKKALKLFPEFPEAQMLIGTAYMDMKKWSDAQKALEKAIEMDGKLGAAHLALGSCLNAQGNFAAAEKPLLRGLELESNAGPGHWELGRVYWTMQRWPEAETHARKAVELAPALAPAHLLMGNVLLQKRDALGALAQFKEYLRLDPEGPFAATTRDVVGKLERAVAGASPAKPLLPTNPGN